MPQRNGPSHREGGEVPTRRSSVNLRGNRSRTSRAVPDCTSFLALALGRGCVHARHVSEDTSASTSPCGCCVPCFHGCVRVTPEDVLTDAVPKTCCACCLCCVEGGLRNALFKTERTKKQHLNARHYWQTTDAHTMVSKMMHAKEMMTVEVGGTTVLTIPAPVGAHGNGLRHYGADDAGSQRHGSDGLADGCPSDGDE